MREFSAGRAIGAGFSLIGREPAAFLAWTLVYLVVGILPQLGVMATIAPAWIRLVHEVSANAESHAALPADVFRMQGAVMQVQPIAWLSSLVSHALVLGAVYRAVLYPEDRRFLFLRLSAREVWLGLVILVLVVMLFIGMFAVMIPLGVIAGIASAVARDSVASGLLAVAAVFAGFGVLIWAALRFSLATPMSFAERNFRVFESWPLTAGHAAKMFGVGLALVVIAWISEMVIVGAAAAAALGSVGFEGLRDWFARPAFDLAAAAPWIAIGAVAVALLSSFVLTLFGAAWGEIYKAIAAGVEPEPGVAR